LKKKLGINVSGCCEIVITSHWLHELCDEYMLAVLGEQLLIPGQVRVAVGLACKYDIVVAQVIEGSGERTAFILPEMMGVVCCMPLREVIGGAIDLSDTGWRPKTLFGTVHATSFLIPGGAWL
jgi:hypothetical protein